MLIFRQAIVLIPRTQNPSRFVLANNSKISDGNLIGKYLNYIEKYVSHLHDP